MLADRRIVSLRQTHDEAVGLRVGCSCNYLVVRGVELSIPDIFADRGPKKEYILADICNLSAQRAARNGRNILTVDENRPPLGLMEPQDQIEHGRLAPAGRADKRRCAAG